MPKVIGKLVVIGDEFVSEKLIRIIEWLVAERMFDQATFLKFDVSGKVLDKEGKSVYGMVEANSMGIIINLPIHIQNVIDEGTKIMEGAAMRVDCRLWWSLLNTVLHEIFECQHLYTVKEEGSECEMPSEELIDALAEEFIDVMAKDKVDIEPQMSAWMLQQMAGLYTNIEKAEMPGEQRQKELFASGLMVSDSEMKLSCRSFREYRRLTSDSKDDPAWLKPIEQAERINEAIKALDTAATKLKVALEAQPVVKPEAKRVEEVFEAAKVPAGEWAPANSGIQEDEAPIEYQDYAGEEEHVDSSYQEPTAGGQKAGGLVDYTVKILDGLPKNDHIPVAAFKAMMTTLATRMHNHIFQKCGWNPRAEGSGFESVWNVVDSLYIADIPYIQEILVGYDKMVAFKGQMQKKVCHPVDWNGEPAGCISGIVFAKSGLPAFNIYINYHGKQYARSLIPQNKNSGNKWAVKARNGECISYLKDRNTSGNNNNLGAVVGVKGFEFWAKR